MSFSHINKKGNPKMVNVSDKKITKRTAIARGTMFLGREVVSHFSNDELMTKKGPVFQTATSRVVWVDPEGSTGQRNARRIPQKKWHNVPPPALTNRCE